jgi:hypothetical protein
MICSVEPPIYTRVTLQQSKSKSLKLETQTARRWLRGNVVRPECCRPTLRDPVPSSRPAVPDLLSFQAAVRRSRTCARPLHVQGDTPAGRPADSRQRAHTMNGGGGVTGIHAERPANLPVRISRSVHPEAHHACPRVFARPFSARKRERACSGLNLSGDCRHPRKRGRVGCAT